MKITREQAVEILTTSFMEYDESVRENNGKSPVKKLIREGFRGFNNFSNEELIDRIQKTFDMDVEVID